MVGRDEQTCLLSDDVYVSISKKLTLMTGFVVQSHIYDTVVVRFHWWFQIWNLIVGLVTSFGEFDVSPFKEIGAALACPRGISKMAAKWHDFNSIQVYLYSAFYDTIVAKQLYRKLSFYNIFIYCRNLIYLTYGKIVVPSKQKLFVQPKLKNNNARLIRYNCSTRLWDALCECLAKEMCL